MSLVKRSSHGSKKKYTLIEDLLLIFLEDYSDREISKILKKIGFNRPEGSITYRLGSRVLGSMDSYEELAEYHRIDEEGLKKAQERARKLLEEVEVDVD